MSNKQEEFNQLERDRKELAKKEIKEKAIEAKIETAVKVTEVAAKLADKLSHLGIVEPVSAGMTGEVVAQAVEILRNHEATEAYIKGVAKEKIIEVKEFIADKFPEKDAAKEWEKDIAQKEQAINEKFDKEIKETEKSLQKRLNYIENKFDDKAEKENKLKELKEIVEKVKTDIEKDRNTELKQQEERKSNLEKIKEATNGMIENERQRIIEQQRELERKLEIEKQQELERKERAGM